MCYNNVNNNAATTTVKIVIHTLRFKCFFWCYADPSPALLSPQVGDFIVWMVGMVTLAWFWFGFSLMFARSFHAFLSLCWSAVLLYPNFLEMTHSRYIGNYFCFLFLTPVSSFVQVHVWASLSDWGTVVYSKCLCLCQAGASSHIFHVCSPLLWILSLHFSRPLLT